MSIRSVNEIGINDCENISTQKRKKTSEVWNHFSTIEKGEDGRGRVTCNYCKKSYLYGDSKNGTSTLSRHMGVCKKKPNECTNVGAISEQGKVKDRVVDQKICRELIAQSIIEHDLPFKWVEYRSVRQFHQYLNPDFQFITRNTAASDVLQMYERQKERLKLVLKNIRGMLCLTCDVWTACTNAGYICLTVHYVDEKWRLNNKILSFCDMPPPHSGFELSKKVYDCLVDWGIDRKIFSITLDNASANDVMVRLLKQQLLLQNSLLCDGEFFHVRCCAHILNLIVQDGLKVASVALGKIRDSIKYVKASEARMISFQECAQRVGVDITCGLSTDVPTRWNSTYVMLDSAIRYRRVFCSLELQDRNFKCCPSDEEWSRGEKMCAFLYPFYAITNLISGSSYPTSNLYFLQVWKIECLLVENLESDDVVISEMAMNMKLKFDKYWDDYSVILAMGAILDPRLKLQFVEYCYKKLDPLTCQVKIEWIKKKLYMLYNEYKKKSVDYSSSRVSTSQLQDYSVYSATNMCGVERGRLGCTGGQGKLDENLISDYVDYRHRSQGESGCGDSKSNLDKYLEDDQLNQLDDIDVLVYWKENQHRYGELAKMACDVLSIPITSVASESAFSIGAHILNKYRNRLLPKKVQALICTRNWLHGFSTNDESDDEDEDEDDEVGVGASNVGGEE